MRWIETELDYAASPQNAELSHADARQRDQQEGQRTGPSATKRPEQTRAEI